MYGCRQACKIFTDGLAAYLTSIHFSRLPSDPCSFILHSNKNPQHFVLLVITVDDFLVVTNHTPLSNQVRNQLSRKYKLKDLGRVQHLLGWKITHSTEGITISQPSYIQELLDKYGLTNAKTFSSPIASELITLDTTSAKPLDENTHDYKGVIGSLRYLADSTRPDISFIVGFLSRSAHQPTTHDWKSAIRVLRYLKGTKDTGITFPRNFTSAISAYSDSDHAACPSTRRSTTGSIIFYNNAPISWQSKRQRSVSPSTFAAEYVASFHTTELLRTVSNFFTDLNHPIPTPIPLYIDNAAAITTAKAKFPTPKSRHIDVKYHWLREQVHNNFILPTHIPTTSNPADLLTKALKPAQYTSKHPLLRLTTPTVRGD